MYTRLFFANPYKKSQIYSKYLGIKFGKNVRILHFPRWGSEPYLIEIGDNVTITRGVAFVNHDGGVAVFREEHAGLNIYGKIIIGNNVFIGINTIILPNVKIGNNVVIGAGSIVNKDIPDNVVVAGVPAKIIKTLKDYKINSLAKACFINTNNSNEKKEIILNYISK
jgi:acetyltransferase-like isoleucine patch superfamily enzyme